MWWRKQKYVPYVPINIILRDVVDDFIIADVVFGSLAGAKLEDSMHDILSAISSFEKNADCELVQMFPTGPSPQIIFRKLK